ncbi:secretory pathway protein Sec39 [Rhizoctonia solani 123E]|uniref:Secretory pathway protein Sec39 n=1 Tax=Rhizoctonia solani 123E TaxID=1423351 RepID=A0A074S5Y6_9AGAM|nr:secretory pathway protein Sec39 [Rhizoctonia solani 123E]
MTLAASCNDTTRPSLTRPFTMNEGYQRWVDLPNEDVTPDVIRDTLFPLDDKLWVAAACADRILSDVEGQTALLELGLLRTSQASQKIQAALEDLGNSGDDTDPEEQLDGDEADGKRNKEHTKPTESDLLRRALNEDETSRKLLGLRLVLLQRLDLTRTYSELLASGALSSQLDSNERFEDDDPWSEERPLPTSSPSPPWLSLLDFITTDIVQLASLCASTQRFNALKTLFTRHLQDLFPFRLHILESIPAHVSPIEYVDLLPACNFSTSQEETRLSQPWREVPDWVEQAHIRAALADTGVEDFPQFDTNIIERPSEPHPELLSDTELTKWFKRRIEIIDALGLVDMALAFVQHAAALAIPGLDAEGEELSLLARLVYDVPVPEDKPLTTADDWNLARWRSMDPPAVVRAYLEHSTPETVAADIRRLVVPYLFVLDARRQREQTSTSVQTEQSSSDELLYGWILNAPLDLAASLFIASKADLPVAMRVVQKDEDLARLALACLYGSDALDAWPTMSAIFECLPAWEVSEPGENDPDAEEADTTLASLAAFVTPTTAKPRTAPADLYTFFRPLPARALSRALDILDVHLESGEVLSRWGVPAPLRWFVQSAGDATLQRSWAIKMARRSGAEGGEILLDDMVKLSGGALGDLRGAFGALKKDEVVRIFFEGLLSSGRFEMAHDMLNPRGIPPPLSTDAVERLCLAVSREFYDNATSGNIHSGDMKLAYECLNVPLPTPVVLKEREFIEATSRICAFNVVSRPGVPITPLEIRLVKDRLSLVGRILSSTEDAYKHTQIILDLVAKLGFRGDPAAEVKALAMIADAALSSEDFEVAAEVGIRMVKTAVKLRGSDTAAAHEATEICWHTCYQLGRQTEFADTKAKMTLLAHTLELCPPENVNDVLTAWKRLETEKLEAFKAREPTVRQPRRRARNGSDLLAITDLSAPLISPDAAAAAARTFSRVAGAAAKFPFSVRGRLGYGGGGGGDSESVVSGMSTRSRSPESTVSTSARHALSRGVGWLIGAGE